jgi:ribosome-binding protein aMBF1 (putative translation factor)
MAKRTTRNALEIVEQMVGDDRRLRNAIEEETVNSRVAGLLHAARTGAGLTQKRLAEIVGTKQSVIARLESADYEGHSLSMLIRIAEALDNRLVIDLVPRNGTRRTA